MKPSLLQRTIAMIILIAALLPVSLAFGGLPGPLPPAPPAIPTPPPDSEFDYVKVDDARGQAGVAEQIEFGTELKDKIIQYGGTDNITPNHWSRTPAMTGSSRWAEIKVPPSQPRAVPGMIPSTSTAARVTIS